MSQDTEEEQALARIGQALAAEAATIGPTSPACGEAFEDEDVDPPDNVILSEWVALFAWTDLETGETWLSQANDPSMPRHHVDGLITWFVQ